MNKIFDFSDHVEKTLDEAGQVMSDFYDKKLLDNMLKPNPVVNIAQRHHFFDLLKEYEHLKWWQVLRRRKLQREISDLAIIVVKEMVKWMPKKSNTVKFRRYRKLQTDAQS